MPATILRSRGDIPDHHQMLFKDKSGKTVMRLALRDIVETITGSNAKQGTCTVLFAECKYSFRVQNQFEVLSQLPSAYHSQINDFPHNEQQNK